MSSLAVFKAQYG